MHLRHLDFKCPEIYQNIFKYPLASFLHVRFIKKVWIAQLCTGVLELAPRHNKE